MTDTSIRADSACANSARRSFLAGMAAVPLAVLPAAAQAATGLACIPIDSEGEAQAWKRLCDEEAVAYLRYNAACDALSDAQERYYALRPAQPVCEIHTEITLPSGQPYTYTRTLSRADLDRPGGDMVDDPRYARYRAEWDAYAQQDDTAERQAGVTDADRLETLAMHAHAAALRRIWDFPTSNPSIIVEKLKLAIREYGNENEHLAQIADAILTDGGARA